MTEHEKQYWNDILINSSLDKDIFVINNRYYYAMPQDNKSDKDFLGCGGYQFNVRRVVDNKIISSNNVWNCSEIPEEIRDYFKIFLAIDNEH